MYLFVPAITFLEDTYLLLITQCKSPIALMQDSYALLCPLDISQGSLHIISFLNIGHFLAFKMKLEQSFPRRVGRK